MDFLDSPACWRKSYNTVHTLSTIEMPRTEDLPGQRRLVEAEFHFLENAVMLPARDRRLLTVVVRPAHSWDTDVFEEVTDD